MSTIAVRPEAPPVDRSWGPLFVIAGIGSIAFVALLLAALALDVVAPPPVHGGAATLEFIAAHTSVYVAEQVLWIAPSILAVLVFVALYFALAAAHRSLALIGSVVGGVAYALLLAIPTSSRGALSLVYLSERYMAAAPGDRATYAIAAETIIAENNTPTIAGVLATVGILLVSIPMLRSVLPRWVAWLGVATGAIGIVSELLRYAVPQFYWGYGILLWVWFVAVGIALIRLGMRVRGRTGAGFRTEGDG
ncbi:protein of unknown function [Raineyella antarctica]|uniref:DUF4386 family protein n=1 Tax=Raineyella antarctica TaxID=1577474 RepID=A0A1G6GD43_9ACTN|nr:DUF4386 family protein [Raineyella antarctica]SDB79922.1 protein of unknown function [Raineyella antarctica]